MNGRKGLRLAVLVSGGGTNLQAIIDHCEQETSGATVAVVISSRRDAYALERARRHGIAAEVRRRRDYPSEEAYSAALLECISRFQADLVVLAGFMSVLGQPVIAAYRHRIMNIHPALLPSFGGPGMYGEHVHQAVLDYGAKVSGCTVMFVDEGVDTGPVILQAAVPVQEDDTAASLAARVLVQEHRLYPEAISLYAQGRLAVEGRRVRILPEERGKSDD